MKEIKGYYAYLLIVGGLILSLAAAQNWMLCIVAYALISGGALALNCASLHYQWASIAADVLIVLEMLGRGAVAMFGDSSRMVHLVLETVSLVPYLLMGCFLLLGAAQQFRAAGEGTKLEWLLLVVWSAGVILPLLLLLGGGLLNEWTFAYAAKAAEVLRPVGLIALIVELFRAQREYIRTGGNSQ
ncbi:hypothetical protein [Agathobaculum sp.]|uniref:hypothetical protein n=1 Tax=Agathobaculum sp. TaxID=2048138 RepID=UPI002A832A89|nr:hypothetical protein [Agathobaculum sp.]MDY3619411.1 hypothetical protein [Agathobaculum sp.]